MYHSIRTSCRPEQLVIEQDGQRLYHTIMGPPSASSMLRIGKWSRIMIQWSKWSECSTVARHKGAGLSCGAAAAGHLLGQCGQEPGASHLSGISTTQLPPLLQPGHQGYCSLRRYLLTTTTRTTDSLDCCMWEVQGSGSVWFNVHVSDVVNGKSKTDIWYGIIFERLSINNSFALKSKTWFLSTTEFHDQYKHLIQCRQKVVGPRQLLPSASNGSPKQSGLGAILLIPSLQKQELIVHKYFGLTRS